MDAPEYNKTPIISIIVPVYNVQEYLQQCIESVINQTLRDIEIILVDDGSTDSSGRICDEYKIKDSRVRVIHKSNEGLSCARNDGIAISKAPFIMFLDGDDWVDSQFCEIPYKDAIDNQADLVLFLYNRVTKNQIIGIKTELHTGKLNEIEGIQFNILYASYVWLGLYRRYLFDNVKFPPGKIHEDVFISHRLIHSAKTVFFEKSFLYNYRAHRPGSITSSNIIHNNPDVRYVLENKVRDLCKWGYREYALNDAFSLVIWYGWKSKKQKPFVEIIKQSKISGSCLSYRRKLLLGIFKISPAIFDMICIVMGKRGHEVISPTK